MPSITNLRNLGGFYNQKRELIKPGLVFRSGQLYDLTTEQIQYLSETLKITRIVDMRSTAEHINNFQTWFGHKHNTQP